MIELQNLSKQYDRFLAVDNLNLTIGDGEFFGLLGPVPLTSVILPPFPCEGIDFGVLGFGVLGFGVFVFAIIL